MKSFVDVCCDIVIRLPVVDLEVVIIEDCETNQGSPRSSIQVTSCGVSQCPIITSVISRQEEKEISISLVIGVIRGNLNNMLV